MKTSYSGFFFLITEVLSLKNQQLPLNMDSYHDKSFILHAVQTVFYDFNNCVARWPDTALFSF